MIQEDEEEEVLEDAMEAEEEGDVMVGEVEEEDAMVGEVEEEDVAGKYNYITLTLLEI